MDPEELNRQLDELKERANAAVEAAEQDTSKHEETKALLDEIKPKVEALEAEKKEQLRQEEMKSMKGRLTTLQETIDELKKPAGEFVLPDGSTDDGSGNNPEDPYASGGSVFNDIRLANKGVNEARERLTQNLVLPTGLAQNEEGKAMSEGVNAQGGFLVRPQIERRLVEAKELDNVVRQLSSTINVNTNAIQLDQLGISTAAGWVAELAQKPETTGVTLATITANIFAAAGLATISNQLLADSDPAVDNLVTRDLGKRLTAIEETAFLVGTGTNQPLGILNTPGLGATTLTPVAVADLLDAILTAVAQVETDHGMPSAILMHPRTWTRILKSKDAQGAYMIAPDSGPQDPRTGLRGPEKTLWGYRVVTSNRMPTNLGAGTNESRVIVGDFSEALVLDRSGITVDESEHVYFTSNQTVFRAEMRVGFTAARTPLAFNVIGGAGLANG